MSEIPAATCVNCADREATIQWIGDHGAAWCRLCMIRAALAELAELAGKVSELGCKVSELEAAMAEEEGPSSVS